MSPKDGTSAQGNHPARRDWEGLKYLLCCNLEFSAFRPGEGYTSMLVLSRKKNESIVINNDITITVVEIRGDKVRLGIVAPKDVPVHRQEVWEAIHGQAAPAPTVVTNPADAAGHV